jgi:hypothetical protein
VAVYACTDCASLLDRDDSCCDHCGSTNRSITHVIDEAVTVDDWLAVKQKEREAAGRIARQPADASGTTTGSSART